MGAKAYRLSGQGLVRRMVGPLVPLLSAYRMRIPSTVRKRTSGVVVVVMPSMVGFVAAGRARVTHGSGHAARSPRRWRRGRRRDPRASSLVAGVRSLAWSTTSRSAELLPAMPDSSTRARASVSRVGMVRATVATS